MKLGILSAIMGDYTFKKVIDTAADIGYQCVELACWPKGKAERRYAGVTHIDVERLDDEMKREVLSYCEKKGVEISALSYYPNTLDPDPERRNTHIDHLKMLIRAAAFLGVDTVGTFVGRDQNKSVEDNLQDFKEVWPPIVEFAAENNVRIAIENCPMLFTDDEWPGGQNLATSPAILRRLFEIIPSANFGLNFDPSHFIWQRMDYLRPLYEFKDRIFHVHFKDIKLYKDRLNDYGIMTTPLNYMSPKLPGLGDVNWKEFVSALYDIGYNGAACVEIEDRAFEGSEEKLRQSLEFSYRHMRQFVVS